MATSTSWTLWKRLPPRYQLSVRTFVDEDDLARNSPPGSPKQQRKGSPRQPRAENKSPRPPQTSPTQGQKRSIQNIPDITDKDKQDERPGSPSGFYFPFRKSGYIDHFKTQQRVNSARILMATDDRSRSPSPTGRINKQNSHQESKTTNLDNVQCMSAKSRTTEIQHSMKRCAHHSPSSNTDTNETYPTQHSNKIEQRKYLVRETDEGTMYIDRGKIIYFRRYRSNPVSQSSYLSRYNDGSYLASIRREYLTKPRLLAMGPEKKNVKDETKVHEERANYNRKVAHILDYYSYPDEDNISLDDISRYTSPGRRANSPRRQMNMTNRNVKRIYFAYPKPEHECRTSNIQDVQNDQGFYFKVNQQSKLHERNFYLKTPGHKSSFREADLLDCACGMCRIEMQLALMAQSEAENHAKFLQEKMVKTKIQNKVTKTSSDKKTMQDGDLKLDLSKINKDEGNDVATSPLPRQNETEQREQTLNAKDSKQEQTLTVTIPKMETNREISEVAKENDIQTKSEAE